MPVNDNKNDDENVITSLRWEIISQSVQKLLSFLNKNNISNVESEIILAICGGICIKKTVEEGDSRVPITIDTDRAMSIFQQNLMVGLTSIKVNNISDFLFVSEASIDKDGLDKKINHPGSRSFN